MTQHLWPLLRLEAGSQEELKEKYRDVYTKNYVRDDQGVEVKLYEWQGKRVRFHAGTFDHAFSKSSSYRFGNVGHDVPLAPERARRILWIKEVLTASRGTIERRQQIRPDSRGRPRKRPVLIVTEERYVVVLQERPSPGELEFITAFEADPGYWEKIRRESTLLEIKKPQS